MDCIAINCISDAISIPRSPSEHVGIWWQTLKLRLGINPDDAASEIRKQSVKDGLHVLDRFQAVGFEVVQACVARLDTPFIEGEGRAALAGRPEYETLWDELERRGYAPEIANGMRSINDKFEEGCFLLARPRCININISLLRLESSICDKLLEAKLHTFEDLMTIADDLHTLPTITKFELGAIEESLLFFGIRAHFKRSNHDSPSRFDFNFHDRGLPNNMINEIRAS